MFDAGKSTIDRLKHKAKASGKSFQLILQLFSGTCPRGGSTAGLATDHGFIDVMQQKIIDPVLEVVK